MKVSTALLKKINEGVNISGVISDEKVNEIVSGIIQQEITSGLIQQELVSGEAISNINQQIQNIKQYNVDLSGMLTFQ